MTRSVVSSVATSRFRGAVILLLSLTAACSGDRKTGTPADTALDRDLTLAAQAGAVAPAPAMPLGDTAVASQTAPPKASPPVPTPPTRQNPPRRAPAPAPVPAARAPEPEKAPATVAAAPAVSAPAPAPTANSPEVAASGSENSAGNAIGKRSLGIGTMLQAATASQLCSLANRPGDRIVATLNSAVTGPDGASLPAGTPIVVEMATAEPPADFAFRVKGVQVDGTFIPVEGRVTSEGATTDRPVSNGGDKGKVATGAVVGAILGRVLGGGTKGTVIGAAGGAAAGTVLAQRNSTVEHCLPAGASITVTLTSPLELPGSTL